jgi:hypothetical protein
VVGRFVPLEIFLALRTDDVQHVIADAEVLTYCRLTRTKLGTVFIHEIPSDIHDIVYPLINRFSIYLITLSAREIERGINLATVAVPPANRLVHTGTMSMYPKTTFTLTNLF